jgi:putative transposase
MGQNLTYQFRVKSNIGFLKDQSRKVNFVFNYCNDIQKQAVKRGNKWPTGYDFTYLTAGSSTILGLHSGTIGVICLKYAQSRKNSNKAWLKWRTYKTNGWVPLKGQYLKVKEDFFVWHGKVFKVFNSRSIPQGAKICDGSNFSQDSRGRWYLNVVLEIPAKETDSLKNDIGVDLGLKDFATLSDGRKFEGPKTTAKYADKLAKAQRANKKRLVLKLHDKIKNTRKDFHHKLSTQLTKEYSLIIVGNVSASGLAKTKMAKSVLDAGWSSFRQMLAYKSVMNGVRYVEVNEAFSTQICSSCGSKPDSRPRGIADLGIREWTCCDCGSVHDRDVNAAKNILRYGQVSPVEGDLILGNCQSDVTGATFRRR